MNIFGVGGAELVLIIIIMLIVAGPKRMIRWAYVIGQYVGKFRIVWEQMVDMLQDEVDAAGLDVKIPKQIPTKQNIAQTVSELAKPYTQELEKSIDDVKNPMQSILDETNAVVKDTQKDVTAATTVELGAWDKKKDKDQVTSVSDVKPETKIPEAENTVQGFGAWSQPKSPNDSVDREA